MRGFNLVIVGGNLGADPEIRYTQEGKAVCGFNLAINEKYKTKNGEEKEDHRS